MNEYQIPFIVHQVGDTIVNLTQCDNCDKVVHPQEALWGENNQPYCSTICAKAKDQTEYYDTHFLTSKED